MTIRAKQLEIFKPIVRFVSVGVFQFEWDRLSKPFCAVTHFAFCFFQVLPNEADAEMRTTAGPATDEIGCYLFSGFWRR